MSLIELAHRFLADLARLPLLFKLLVLCGAGAAGWQWWKARQQVAVIAASASWPVYRARVVWAQVSDRQGGGEEPSYWEGLLTYSYTVPGQELEIGEHRKRFSDEEEADEWARRLRDTSVDVRVDPADVKRSVWQETPILTTPSLRAPELDGGRSQRIESWGAREALAAVVFCVAAVGAIFAAWVQLSCLMGKPLISAEKNTAAFFGMHTGAILCGIAGGYIGTRGKWSRSTWQESFKAGATGIGMKLLGSYTTIVFLYGWVRGASNDGDPRSLSVLIFSAVWLLFYATATLTSLSAMQHHDGGSN